MYCFINNFHHLESHQCAYIQVTRSQFVSFVENTLSGNGEDSPFNTSILSHIRRACNRIASPERSQISAIDRVDVGGRRWRRLRAPERGSPRRAGNPVGAPLAGARDDPHCGVGFAHRRIRQGLLIRQAPAQTLRDARPGAAAGQARRAIPRKGRLAGQRASDWQTRRTQ